MREGINENYGGFLKQISTTQQVDDNFFNMILKICWCFDARSDHFGCLLNLSNHFMRQRTLQKQLYCELRFYQFRIDVNRTLRQAQCPVKTKKWTNQFTKDLIILLDHAILIE